MATVFRIVLISDDPYHQGLFKGYCHTHNLEIIETADIESLKAIIQMPANVIIVTESLEQNWVKKSDFDTIRKLSTHHQIPVCYLRDRNNIFHSEMEVTCWVDAVLDAPLEVDQLTNYLHNRFTQHPCFIQIKRNRARRAANDRRRVMLEQQLSTAENKSMEKRSPIMTESPGFTVGPFRIDQRSKCVLLNGKSLNLTRKEFELFELLAQDVGRVFMCDEIIDHVWPENNRVTKSDLYQYMHLLRKKVEIDPNNPHWILTVKGFGYKLNVEGTTPYASS